MSWQSKQQLVETLKMQLYTYDKLKKQANVLEKQVETAKAEELKYGQQLIDARKELHKLEKNSVINLFRNWTGRRDELLEQRFDTIAVKELKLIEAQLMIEDLQDDLVTIIYKRNAINDEYVLKELEQMEAEMAQWLAENAPKVAVELTEVTREYAFTKQLIIEIHEAIAVGNEAIGALSAAANSLNSASDYSTWDTFFGGGFIVTSLKHDKLEESNASIHDAQISLQRFQNELIDVQEMKHATLNIEIDGFVKFADYFFDDIFSEWSIHSKIATSNNQISRVEDDVYNTLLQLERKLSIAIEKQQELEQRKKAIFNTKHELLFL